MALPYVSLFSSLLWGLAHYFFQKVGVGRAEFQFYIIFSFSYSRNNLVYHSNISAVQYEIGKYADCVHTIDTALSLLASSSPPNPQLATKLLLRKAKSFFYSKKFEECKETLAQLTRECESAGIANLDTDGALAKALEQKNPEYPQFSICRSIWYVFYTPLGAPPLYP